LFIDLRAGQDHPVSIPESLLRLRQALGHPVIGPADSDRIDPDRAAEQLRLALAHRRMLLVLDDAGQVDQIAPLLPGHSASAVIVTSRHRLTTLPGAGIIDLGPLPQEDALRLLGRIAGPDRVMADTDTSTRLVYLCGRLPLAIRAAGAKLANRPHWPVKRLTARLDHRSGRLDELTIDDLDIRASIAGSYRHLDPTARQAVLRLSTLDGAFTPHFAAEHLHIPLASADEILETLIDTHMLEVLRTDNHSTNYRLPELVRLYVQEMALNHSRPDQ
jgi:hypothetical protein